MSLSISFLVGILIEFNSLLKDIAAILVDKYDEIPSLA